MRFVVKQAAPEAPAEKPVELSIDVGSDGWARVEANGSVILAFRPDGIVVPYTLTGADHALGFVTDSDCRIAIHGRIPG